MDNSHIEIWNRCLQFIKDNLDSSRTFETWFEPIKAVRLQGSLVGLPLGRGGRCVGQFPAAQAQVPCVRQSQAIQVLAHGQYARRLVIEEERKTRALAQGTR